jgi:putative transposase
MKGIRQKIILSEDEKKQLTAISNKLNAPYRLVMRAKLILMSASGEAHKKIAEKFDIDQKIVTKWVKRWIDTGKNGEIDIESRLSDLERPGKPVTFTPEQKCKIIAIACENPEVYGRPITHWTYKEIAEEVIKQGIVDSISETHVGYILRKNDIRPHKIMYWLNGKPDEKKTKK